MKPGLSQILSHGQTALRATATLFFLAPACAPISPERAADLCEERARAAVSPVREVGVGFNTDRGVIANAEVEITSDFIRGRDPQVVYEQCVRQKTGQGPIRPLELR